MKVLSVVVASEPVTDPPVPLNIPPIDSLIAGHPSELVGAIMNRRAEHHDKPPKEKITMICTKVHKEHIIMYIKNT